MHAPFQASGCLESKLEDPRGKEGTLISDLRVLQIPVFFPHHPLTLTSQSPLIAATWTLSGFYSYIQLGLVGVVPAPSYLELGLIYF